jgi:ferredoxin-type protein NapH
MAVNRKGLNLLRIVLEVFALLLVIFLTANHKLQTWLLLFALGIIVSLFAGRLFCGWICPMNTVFRAINFIYAKLKIKRLAPPRFLKNNIIRYGFLAFFAISMIAVKVSGVHVNMLLYIILFSVILTLFINEEFWHRYICPFGTILQLTSRKSRFGLHIDEEACISCGKCQKVCPSLSITTADNEKMRNVNHECLLCIQCMDVCPTDACQLIRKYE